MSTIQLHPYLFFQGNCKAAMEFYQGIFGGELTMQTVGGSGADMPDKESRKD
jgi:PhnB protein